MLTYSILFFIVGIPQGLSQDFSKLQEEADSLFEVQKFTDAYSIYDSIATAGNSSSPQMLLKMAFIKEGLGDYTLALYHLNEYYVYTSDDLVLDKMEKLANEHGLRGYDYTEKDYILSFYHKNYDKVVYTLIGLCIIFLVGVFDQRLRQKRKPVASYVLFVICCVSLVAVFNTGMGYKEAIISKPNTYLMSNPSSSSEVLAIVSEGNKIPIGDQEDVWVETEWNNQKAFIKSKNITPLTSW